MSFFAFIAGSLALSVPVFLRYLPILVVYVLAWAGLITATENIYVIALIGFLLGTFGVAFLFVNGIRGGLQVLRATTAPTASGLMNATTRVLFFHCLLQLMLSIVLIVILNLVMLTVVIPATMPDLAPILEKVFSSQALEGFAMITPEIEAQLRTPYLIYSILIAAVMGGVIGVFGVPMAAVAANAVQHSPQNDMIYGMTEFWPHQMLLYVIAQLPVILVNAYLLPVGGADEFNLSALPIALIMSWIYLVYAPSISWAGMALAYKTVRDDRYRQRQAESRPEIDYEAERENLRSLRRVRTEDKKLAGMYDPRQNRGGASAETAEE